MTFTLAPQDGQKSSVCQTIPIAAPNHKNDKWLSKLAFFILGFTASLILTMSFCPYYDDQSETIELLQPLSGTDSGLRSGMRKHADIARYMPQQLHLSLGTADKKEVIVTWSTIESVNVSLLHLKWNEFAEDGVLYERTRVVEAYKYSTGISERRGKNKLKTRTLYGYYTNLTGLRAEQYDYYVTTTIDKKTASNCSNEIIFESNIYSFKNPWYNELLGINQANALKVAIYGDLGLINGQSIPRLIEDVDNDMYDAIIHNGDFGYDLNDGLGTVGDSFMNSIEPIAARVVYQTSVGNHEVAENFTHYAHRFQMVNTDSGERNSFYYSFNLGPVHFVAYSTEFYYFLEYSGLEPLVRQYEWLKMDLREANLQRDVRPWIVVFGHRPMYCSSRDEDDCTKPNNILRKGLPIVGLYSLEKLFYEQGVDLIVEAHEHSYERFLPLYDGEIRAGTENATDPYLNARGPVHVITGSAGCKENLDPFLGKPAVGSVSRVSDYGFTRMRATYDAIYMEQISDDKAGDVVDSYTLRKTRARY